EEQLVFDLVLYFRQPYRPTERRAERAITIAWLGNGSGLARQRRGEERVVVEKVVGVEHLVTFVPVTAPVILARAGFGNNVDAGRGVTGVLCLIAVEQDFDFTDGVEVDRARKDIRTAQVVAAHAVHVESILSIAPTL